MTIPNEVHHPAGTATAVDPAVVAAIVLAEAQALKMQVEPYVVQEQRDEAWRLRDLSPLGRGNQGP